MPRRRTATWAHGAAATVALCLALAVPDPASADPAPSPTTTPGPDAALTIRQGFGVSWQADTTLHAGEPATRYLDVVSGMPGTALLTGTLSARGELSDRGGFVADASSCSVPWTADGRCTGERERLLPAGTVLDGSRTLPSSYAPPGTVRHLRFVFTLSPTGAELAGTSARVTLAVAASSSADRVQELERHGSRGHGSLARTGIDPWAPLALAAALLAAGAGALAAARERRRPALPDADRSLHDHTRGRHA